MADPETPPGPKPDADPSGISTASPRLHPGSHREPRMIDGEAILNDEPAALSPNLSGSPKLEAEKLEADSTAAAAVAPPQPAPVERAAPKSKGGLASAVALCIGALVGGGGIGWWTQQQLATQQADSDRASMSLAGRIDALEARAALTTPIVTQVAPLEKRLAVLEQKPAPTVAPQDNSARDRLTKLEQQIATLATGLTGSAGTDAPDATLKLQQRLDALEATSRVAAAAAPSANAASANAASAADASAPLAGIAPADNAALEVRFAGVEQQLAALGKNASKAVVDTEALGSRLGEIDKLQERVSALDKLQQRVGVIETDLAKPKIDVRATQTAIAKSAGETDAVALSVVAQSIAKSLERGEPFADALATAQSLGADAANIDVLKPVAATGAPTPRALAQKFRAVSASVLAAGIASAPASQGFLDRVSSAAEKLVRVRPVGETAGEDTASLVSRIEAALDRGAVGPALEAWAKLPEASRQLSDAWAREARSRQSADTAAQAMLNAALAQLGRKENAK